MKKTLLLITIGFVLASMLSACYYDNEEDLYGVSTTCDTMNVTFSGTINPVIQQKCISCHGGSGASGGVRLDSYEEVKVYADNGKLYGSISHASGYSPMPSGQPKLDDCTLLQFQIWIRNGAPDN